MEKVCLLFLDANLFQAKVALSELMTVRHPIHPVPDKGPPCF